MAAVVQRHPRTPSPAHPHGHGFVAATSVKRAGYVTEPPDLVMLTRPDSRGWRSACRTGVWNSASSSRNRTPWWALLISPRCARPLPPAHEQAVEGPAAGDSSG